MTTVYDIATIYGPNAGAWDWRPLHEYQENSLSLLYGDIPVQHSYDMWAGSGINEETGEYELDTPVEWSLLLPFDGELCEASMLDVRGRLIGGCTDVLDDIIGTPFEDLKGFAERYKKRRPDLVLRRLRNEPSGAYVSHA
jgi:muramoyltetrapeptide carboxypeptidase LdcA involved in peptidoglycan recycling